ncbi:unnamed protein product [Symbiodinium natans]|uniref:Uncharacterized protein n=1 Tax=Symbiodinium natans TaxID=878477 RepID=A0A812SSZ1_9DINO|nr:unnamed protein product [Symbiodinium natans]
MRSRTLLLGSCIGSALGSCQVELLQDTLRGPGGCTEAGAEQLVDPFAKAVVQCYMQCMAAFTIELEEVMVPNTIHAEPQKPVCEHPELSMACSPLRFTCSKPLSEIPNSCRGASIGLVRRPRMVWYPEHHVLHGLRSQGGKLLGAHRTASSASLGAVALHCGHGYGRPALRGPGGIACTTDSAEQCAEGIQGHGHRA